MRIGWHILDAEAYIAEYDKALTQVSIPDEASKEMLCISIATTQKLIEDALAVKWKKVDDFEVGWDFDDCYHVCGDVYSDVIISPHYVQTIVDASLANATASPSSKARI